MVQSPLYLPAGKVEPEFFIIIFVPRPLISAIQLPLIHPSGDPKQGVIVLHLHPRSRSSSTSFIRNISPPSLLQSINLTVDICITPSSDQSSFFLLFILSHWLEVLSNRDIIQPRHTLSTCLDSPAASLLTQLALISAFVLQEIIV